MLALHSPTYFQWGILLFIKKIVDKYPNVKEVIDFNYMGNEELTTKEDERIMTNEDPQLLVNIHQISIYTAIGK